ncbi:MAG: glycosyltransferase family 2 protein [Eggerthellaceae bacterium]|nr:glycosyltransferase family 2 protein [Eggerthellaceae bacterium]
MQHPSNKDSVSVVVPAYNEEASIPLFMERAHEFEESVGFAIEFVFVDDGSKDNTYELLVESAAVLRNAKVVKLSRNFGSHAAIRAGIMHSDSDFVVIYSIDMPEPIEDIEKMFLELRDGYELVYTCREGYDGGFGSRMFARLVNKYIEPTYPANGLVGIAFGPKIKEQLNMHPEANSSIFFQVFQMGFSVKELPSRYLEREEGASKWTFRKKVKLLIDSFVMFSFAPIRFISTIGFLLAFLGFIWALAIVIIKLTGVIELAAGWPTLLSVMLIGFGITNVSLGVIAEYLVRDLDATRDRPAFIVDTITQADGRHIDE